VSFAWGKDGKAVEILAIEEGGELHYRGQSWWSDQSDTKANFLLTAH
jgi:hypothetical protein